MGDVLVVEVYFGLQVLHELFLVNLALLSIVVLSFFFVLLTSMVVISHALDDNHIATADKVQESV